MEDIIEISYIPLAAKLQDCPPEIAPRIQAILDLDFTPQKRKFVDDPDFIGWTDENIDFAELLYKNFLYLRLSYPDAHRMAPSVDIDDFWHGHILDTYRYYPDCIRIFGQMMHHNPYFGIGSSAEEKLLGDTFELTQRLHIKEFGDKIYEVRAL